MNDYSSFHAGLQQWYDQNGRKNLPWRNTRNPYAIYLSEVMLQQTQVKTVLERFYFPFLESFPSLQALSAAPEAKVLKAWEGLGYYSRARNLHKAAKQSGGHLPSSVEALMALPGIGKNTAHAVAAFAFYQPVPVMEANVKRVLCRIFTLKEPKEKELWAKAEALLNTKAPYDYNQAMMDIEAMVCTKSAPTCQECPAAIICEGKHAPELYPSAKKKKAVPTRRKRITIITDLNNCVYCLPRATRFLVGMYGFHEVKATAESFELAGQHYAFDTLKKLGDVRHTYSHFSLEAEVYHLPLTLRINSEEWLSHEEVLSVPLSRADIKAWALFHHLDTRAEAY